MDSRYNGCMKIKKETKMFNVTVTDEMNESIAMFAANSKDLLKLIKEYTSAESLDSTPIYSILTELDEEYYNNLGSAVG